MSKTFKRKTLPWQSIDNKTLILSSEEGEVHELNQTGTFLWHALEKKMTIEDLVLNYADNGHELSESVTEDFLYFLKKLTEKKLIEFYE